VNESGGGEGREGGKTTEGDHLGVGGIAGVFVSVVRSSLSAETYGGLGMW